MSCSAAFAANPGTTVAKVELDNEKGAIVYSVELSDRSDMKVYAGNAAGLFTDRGGDLESRTGCHPIPGAPASASAYWLTYLQRYSGFAKSPRQR